jgi:hypothetical protein
MIDWLWNGLLDWPRQFAQNSLGLDLSSDVMVLASKVGVILVLLFVGWFIFTEIATRFRDFKRRRVRLGQAPALFQMIRTFS